jgi:hypothetical protein
LWVGLERWGIESAASVIEAKIQEFGGDIKIETVADKVHKAQEEIKENQNRVRILTSNEGLILTHEEYNKLILTFKQQLDEIKLSQSDWHLNIRENQNQGIDIISYGYFLTIQFYPSASNTPEGTYVFLSLWDGVFDERGYKNDPFNEYTQLEETRLRFDINKQNEYGWSDKENSKNFKLTNEVVEHWLTIFFDAVKKHRLKNRY